MISDIPPHKRLPTSLHDFTFTLSNGKPARIIVQEYDDKSWQVTDCFDRAVKSSIVIPPEDIDDINFLAERLVESAQHANDDTLYEQWKDRKLGDVQ